MKYFRDATDKFGFAMEKVKSWSLFNCTYSNQETLEVHLIEGENIFLHGSDITRFFDAIRGEE